MPYCAIGDHEAPEEAFYRRTRNGRTHLQSGCIPCRKNYGKEHYDKNRQTYIDKAARQRKRDAEWFASLKAGPCLDCNGTFPAMVMQFHHIDPATKSFNPSGSFARRGRAAVEAEVEKCVLLCANCHILRHHHTPL